MPQKSHSFRHYHTYPRGYLFEMVPTWVCISFLFVACDQQKTPPSTDGQGGEGSCVEGKLGCACYGNQTCDSGLECRDLLCEALKTGDGDAGDGDGDGDGDGGAQSTEPIGSGGRPPGSSGGAEGSGGAEDGGSGGRSSSSGGSSSGGGNAVDGNLIFDGAFDAGLDGWVANPDIGKITSDGAKQRACFSTDSSGQFTLAWPADFGQAFTIKPGVTYQISFRAVSTLGIEIWVRIRQPQEPYTWYFNEVAQLKETWTEHSHSVTLDSGSSNRGIAFIGTMSAPGTTCFDDVVVKEAD